MKTIQDMSIDEICELTEDQLDRRIQNDFQNQFGGPKHDPNRTTLRRVAFKHGAAGKIRNPRPMEG